MKHIGKYLIGLIFVLFGFQAFSFANIPNEYYANYKINDDWEDITRLFIEIEAINKIGDDVPSAKFSELNTHFENIFPHFPTDYSFKVIYQQCLLLSDDLSDRYDYNTFISFMDKCYSPFNDIIRTINSKYTTIARAEASPQFGPAPLTVTFDARMSQDPSDETIPSKNFYWYYRDVDGVDKVIGQGPVLSYTFEEAGNYIVHLTVRSSNRQNRGIFDGEETLSVDVTPKSAIIAVYANGQKLRTDKTIKLGVQEAQRGVVFDGSATIAMGGRVLQAYEWNINSRNGFSYTRAGDGSPEILRVALPDQGDFQVELIVTDNEGNQISEEFDLVVTDPVSIIKASPEEGTTSTTFSFDASASYAVTSRIRLFTREVFDQNGDKLDTIQGKSIQQRFLQPGTYTIKLTAEDDLGQTDIDTYQVFVESTVPVPQFTITPALDLKYPSQFLLDASYSADLDIEGGDDELSYQWRFSSSNEKINILNSQEEDKKILIDVNELGKQTITLQVSDKYGKINEISKEIDVESILRPQLFITPVATVWGDTINFAVTSNEPILSYEWDFGDGEKRTLQTDIVSHKYSEVGTYTVTLKVIGQNGMSNEVEKLVFIGEKNGPIAAYQVRNANQMIMTQNDECLEIIDDQETYSPAYRVDRYATINIDVSSSVNTKGLKNDLVHYFQPKNDEIYKRNNFTYKPSELGCQYIDYTLEDASLGKNTKTRIRFKVVNALPTLENVLLSFPQFGDSGELGMGGVGLQTDNNVKDIFNSSFDPLIIKVSGSSPVDPDGYISYFKRYYYLKDDPTRILETKITPGDIPYTFFSLPKTPGEFMFGVTIYDNDEGKQRSEDVIGQGPIVFFPPDTKKPDIPLVTLKTDKISVEVGDEVEFNVISKIISDRPDFIKNRTIQYDFDGDGERDFTTKKDRVTYVYTKPNEQGHTPRAAVIYRGYKGIGEGGNIIVRNGLKPRLLYESNGKLAIFRDISIGDISNKEICLDLLECKKVNDDYLITDGVAFSFLYPDYGKKFLSMDVIDTHANSASKRWPLTLTDNASSGVVDILSIPSVSEDVIDKTEIFVGKNLDNAVLFYVTYNGDYAQGDCYVDTNIHVDSNGDGIKDQDRDFLCNELHLQQYEPNYESYFGRIYYQVESKIISKDFSVSFLDFQLDLDPDTKRVYQKISNLVTTIDTTNKINDNLQQLLVSLRDGLIDKVDTSANVVMINDYITTNEIQLADQEVLLLDEILDALATKSTEAAQGSNIYDQAKAEILTITPFVINEQLTTLFTQFEQAVTNQETSVSEQDQRKELLSQIVQIIAKQIASSDETQTEDQISQTDMDDIVMKNICDIATYYTISTTSCSTDGLRPIAPDIEATSSGGMPGWLKGLLIVFAILMGALVVLVTIFAVRAKMRQAREEEESLQNNPQ